MDENGYRALLRQAKGIILNTSVMTWDLLLGVVWGYYYNLQLEDLYENNANRAEHADIVLQEELGAYLADLPGAPEDTTVTSGMLTTWAVTYNV